MTNHDKHAKFFIKALDDFREELRQISTIDIVAPAAVPNESDVKIEDQKYVGCS